MKYDRKKDLTGESPFKLVDGQNTENFFFCPVCQDLMYQPISLCCGHTVCKTCLENLIEKSRPPAKCPSCRKEIKDTDRDLNVNVALNILLNKLRITCTNEGCSWEGVNGERQDHWSNCVFVKVLCSDGCGFAGSRSIVGEHGKTCPNKKEKCQFCSKGFSRRELENHEEHCFERPPAREEKLHTAMKHLLNHWMQKQVFNEERIRWYLIISC